MVEEERGVLMHSPRTAAFRDRVKTQTDRSL